MIPREGKAPMRWRTIASLSFAAPALVACTAPSVEVVASGSVPAGLETADASLPAAGICDTQPGPVATFTLETDVPIPRCGKVVGDQRLRVVNGTGARVTVTFHGRLYRFDPAAELTFIPTFGSIWEPGVHVLSTSMYGGGGPEIWLGGE
jgi:hypothetical protein